MRWALLAAVAVLVLPTRHPPARRPPVASHPSWGRAPTRWWTGRPVPVRWWLSGAVALAASAITPAAGGAVVAAAFVAARLRRRIARQRDEAARLAALPEVLELVAVAIRAGGTVPAALVLVAERGPPPAAGPFRELLARMAAGVSFLDAVDELPRRLGEPYRPMCSALLSAERDGAPLVSVVAQLAHDAAEARRRAGEAAARQVPVRLLLPLVCCTLPAVMVVTVVPLVVIGGGLPG